MNANERKCAVLVATTCLVGVLACVGANLVWSACERCPWLVSVIGALGTLLLGWVVWRLGWESGYWQGVSDERGSGQLCGAAPVDAGIFRKVPTDSEMLDWLSSIGCASFERHYQAFVSERSELEKKTGGYNGHVDFFSEESQHLDNMPTLREAITRAMAKAASPECGKAETTAGTRLMQRLYNEDPDNITRRMKREFLDFCPERGTKGEHV